MLQSFILKKVFALKVKCLYFCTRKVIKQILTISMSIVAIFASGSGTNAENLIRSFENTSIKVSRIYCGNPNAGVIERANNLNVPITIFSKADFYDSTKILDQLISEKVEFVILAGFLWFIPQYLTDTYNNKILNIHPSLLPKYGGRGMFGIHVHEAVLENNELESGITIHLVNENVDSGKILFQTSCPVLPNDTPEVLASRVHALEYEYFPKIVKQYVEEVRIKR